MVKKIRRIEKYFLLMFLSLITFWRGHAQASVYKEICCGNFLPEACCKQKGFTWENGTCYVS